MIILLYILKLVLVCGLLYGYYSLFLRNKQFHRYNRFYLLGTALLSILLPFINIPLHLFNTGNDGTAFIKTLKVIAIDRWEEPVIIYANQTKWGHWFTFQNGLLLLYLSGAITGLFLLFRSLSCIFSLKKKYTAERFDDIQVYNTVESGTPFSFFNSIFWNRQIPFNTKQGQQIFRHELFHVKQLHSSDILLMELLCSIGWFNPFFHIIKKEIKAIHEFLADAYAVSANDRYEYAELLVLHAIHQKTNSLPNHFFHNQIKRRIAMITQVKNLRGGYISRLMVLPMFLFMFCAYSLKLTGKPGAYSNLSKKINPFTVVIDPGHGGKYPGGTSNGILEKDITLSISQKIKQLSPAYNVNILLTRNSDATAGNAGSLAEDLGNRVALADAAKADLFISIHVNLEPGDLTKRTGFEANISKKDDPASRQFASAILEGLKEVYIVDEFIKQRTAGIQVLDKSSRPAILLECGYLNNPKDLAFITDKDNQEKVAKNILESIVKYQHSNTTGHAFSEMAPCNLTVAGNKKAEPLIEKRSGLQSVSQPTYSLVYKNTLSEMIPQDTNVVLTKVEVEPDYPGGKEAWKNYLIKHLNYPTKALEKEIKGTVVVQFIVDKEGNLSDVKALNGPKELQEESIRVVKESGKWEPAVQNGKKVKAYKRQPIIYKLSVS